MEVWYKDPDKQYMWLLLKSADGQEVLFIGGMYSRQMKAKVTEGKESPPKIC